MARALYFCHVAHFVLLAFDHTIQEVSHYVGGIHLLFMNMYKGVGYS